MYKKLLIASIVMSAGCTSTPPETPPTQPKPPRHLMMIFLTMNSWFHQMH